MENNQENEEYKGFAKWFEIMWKNKYIILFIVAIAGLIGCLITGLYWVAIIPVLMMIFIGYKGFYQYWRDLQQNKTR